MEEVQWLAVDQVAPAAAVFQAPRRQVPVGDVERGVAEDVDSRPESGRQVDPPLVDEAALLGFVEAVVLEALRPPVEQRVRRLPSPEGDEAEVVRAGDEDVLFARLATVAGERRGEVRRQDHIVAQRPPDDLLEGVEDLDVRVEVDDRVHPRPFQQGSQQPRLDRGRELHHVVGGGHSRRIGRPILSIVSSSNGSSAGSMKPVGIVDDEDAAVAVRMDLLERLGEHACVRDVVPRDDRADVHPARPVLEGTSG